MAILGYKVGIDDLILIKFNIKVGIDSDIKTISDRIQTFVRVCSALIVQYDFIEHLFYLKRMDNIYLLAIVLD